jgi:hypothetical protein
MKKQPADIFNEYIQAYEDLVAAEKALEHTHETKLNALEHAEKNFLQAARNLAKISKKI